MLERLMNEERPYGEPQYGKLSKQTAYLVQQLNLQLDEDGRRVLEQLCDTYIRQGSIMLPDAFEDGFWTAVELMLEFYLHKSGLPTPDMV